MRLLLRRRGDGGDESQSVHWQGAGDLLLAKRQCLAKTGFSGGYFVSLSSSSFSSDSIPGSPIFYHRVQKTVVASKAEIYLYLHDVLVRWPK
jgi:hypothetical protein